MSRVFFTSDLHFGHQLVAGLRGFDSTGDHDARIIANWADAVARDDVVWVLGDIAVSSPTAALEILQVLPGRKHLIAGNHDKCHPMHKDSHRHLRRYMEVFDSVQPFARRYIAGWETLLSHFPYGTEMETGGAEIGRYLQYRLPDHQRWLLHGHTHGKERLHGHEIHVGLDAWDLTPVPLETVEQIIVEEDNRAATASATDTASD